MSSMAPDSRQVMTILIHYLPMYLAPGYHQGTGRWVQEEGHPVLLGAQGVVGDYR